VAWEERNSFHDGVKGRGQEPRGEEVSTQELTAF